MIIRRKTKMKHTIFSLLTVIGLLLIGGEAMQAQSWNKRDARKWVISGEWCNGLKDVKPYCGTDMIQFASQYHKQKNRWNKVFAWMATHDVTTLAPGRYDIDGDHCFANVQDAVLRPADQVKIESHKKYIDLQWCVSGIERFGIVKAKYATVNTPYVPDIMFWNTSKIKYTDSTPREFFIFFPDNYHRACVLPPDGTKNIRKVCIKIEYDYQ